MGEPLTQEIAAVERRGAALVVVSRAVASANGAVPFREAPLCRIYKRLNEYSSQVASLIILRVNAKRTDVSVS